MSLIAKQLDQMYSEYYAQPSRIQTNSDLVKARLSGRAIEASAAFSNSSTAILAESACTTIIPQYSFQRAIRPVFGKGDPLPPDFGDHPDFRHLKKTGDLVYCPITTLFMDIESSTRLSLVYPLEQVYKIKNTIILSAIEIIRAFDGHLHRFGGDAVMAYFGGLNARPENSIIDAMNCASVLLYFIEKTVNTRLKKEGYNDTFGIRLGLDYGKKEDVLWANYGYPGMEEVTATSFHVDVASKLQHAAGRNRMMVGDSLRAFIDFPEELLEIKTSRRDGLEVKEFYVEPNHSDANGELINYRQFIVKHADYLQCSPIGQIDSEYFREDTSIPPTVETIIEIYNEYQSGFIGIYNPCSAVLPKNKHIKFKINLPYQPLLPYTARFTVENHGDEARRLSKQNADNHSSDVVVTTPAEHRNLCNWEHTAFRGLHYMTVEIIAHGKVQHRTRLGVYVE